MSKKHFIELANDIMFHNRCNPSDRFSEAQLEMLAGFCQRQNFQFKRNRWFSYIRGECGPNGGAIKNAA